MIRRIRIRAGSASFCPYHTPSVLLKHTRHTLPFQPVAMLVVVITTSHVDSHSTPPHHSHKGRRGLPSTARIERALSECARSASKKGTWPLPPSSPTHFPSTSAVREGRLPLGARVQRGPSQVARCASTGMPILPHPLLIHTNNFINSFFVHGVKCALRQRFTTFLLTSACVG
jgi:hypothetical protein